MASAEGVTFRWEVFNRWCDEYADRHQGMKPKVEDVRRWHRENAEKVWPDSNERPSVFLAVSHNKGRRVRGHKTCEYYKRYRAGKAAEQQRLQPAALSGRRILAVTAAARKQNSDGGRGGPKRPAAEDGLSTELGLEQAEKRRRTHSSARSRHGSAGHSGRGRARRSSSEDVSDDPSWASGGDTSDDDSGSGGIHGRGGSSRRSAEALGAHLQHHAGVHITVVRRDPEGRAIHVQAQPQTLQPLAEVLPAYGFGQDADATVLGRQQYRRNNGGAGRGRGASSYSYDFDYDEGAGSDGDAEDLNKAPPRRRQRGPAYGYQAPLDAEAEEEEDQQRGSGRAYGAFMEVNAAWDSDPKWHPGVAPPECRAPRSTITSEQRLAQQGKAHGVYAGASNGVAVGSAARRIRDGRWLTSALAEVTAAPAPAALKDPLDLLAQAACEALASPRPTQQGEAEAAETQPAVAVKKEEGAQADGCRSSASHGGSAHSGGGACGEERGQQQSGGGQRNAPSHRKHSGMQAESVEEQVGVKHEQPSLAAAEELTKSPAAHATRNTTTPGCASASTQNSSGSGCGAVAVDANGHGAQESAQQQEQQQGASSGAAACDLNPAPPSPHSSALLATDAVEWGAKTEGDAETDDGTAKPDAVHKPPVAATTSSVATAPSTMLTTVLPAPTAGAAIAAGVHSNSTGATSDGSGCGPSRVLGVDMEKDLANIAAANAAAANMAGAAMAAALMQQSRLGLSAPASGLMAPLGPAGAAAAAPLALPPMAAAAVGLPGPLHAPPAMLWPALAGGVGTLTAPPPALAAAAAAPLYPDPMLPMLRLLHMQMAVRQDPITGALSSDASGLAPSHPACPLPPTV